MSIFVDLPSILNQIRQARQVNQQAYAIDLIRRLIQSDIPPGPAGHEILGHALALGDEDGALEVAKSMARNAPDDPQTKLILAERYARVGQSGIALKIVEALKATEPPNPAIDHYLSVYFGHVGQLEAAADHARAAIVQKPDFGDAWVILASLSRLEAGDRAALDALVQAGQTSAYPGAAYALGALHHSEGRHDKAWEAWTLANRFERAKAQVDLGKDIKAMDDIQAAFAALPDPGPAITAQAASPAPVFVVGAPRSGTSLTEQIIASDPRVHAMGETMYSRLATWPLGNLMAADIKRAAGAGGQGIDWSMMGAVYRKLTAIRSQNAGVVTDKGAILHLFVGALARSLPDARFVWVRRDPRDVTLSAYRSNFTGGAHWRHSVGDAAAFLKAHDKMMRGWQAMMPDRILKVEYEALVRNPAQQIPRLMRFLSLTVPDTEGLAFSQTTVSTASFAQIRGRISPKSIGGWQAYSAHFPDHLYEAD